jgi:hypothetical protein
VRPRAKAPYDSIFFNGTVARCRAPFEYQREVESMTDAQLEEHMASQAWQLAKIAETKVRLVA